MGQMDFGAKFNKMHWTLKPKGLIETSPTTLYSALWIDRIKGLNCNDSNLPISEIPRFHVSNVTSYSRIIE